MSFDVFFVNLEPPKPVEVMQAMVAEAVLSVGGRLLGVDHPGGQDIEYESGSFFAWHGPNPARERQEQHRGGGMAVLRGLNLPICRCLYAIAARTDWVMIAASDGARTLRAKESRELPLYEDMPEVVVIGGAEELCTYLEGGFSAWTRYRDRVLGRS